MILDGAKRPRYSIFLIFSIIRVTEISAVAPSSTQQDISWKQYDPDYLLSLDKGRHTEQPDENNAPNPPLLPGYSIVPSSPPTAPTLTPVKLSPTTPSTKSIPSTQSACAETENGSFGDITTTDNVEIPYNYEVQYEKILDGMDVEAEDVISAIEIALSNSILSSLFSKCRTDANNGGRRTNVVGEDDTASGDSARQRLLLNMHDRRLTEIVGINATPNDRMNSNKCSKQLSDETECKIVDGMLTLFLSDSNDRGNMILKTTTAIQNSMNSGGLISAHQSISSISYIDDSYIDDTLGDPDDENTSITSTAVVNSAVAAIITLLVGIGVYLQHKRKRCKKGNGSERSSEHQDSIMYYDDVMNDSIRRMEVD